MKFCQSLFFQMLRIILLSFIHYFCQLTSANPSLGHEMGTDPGDHIDKGKGNRFTQFRVKVLSMTLFFLCELYHIVFYLNAPISKYEFVLFVLITFGIVLRFLAYKELGRLYTFKTGIRQNHTIIQKGPYKYIAHPGYVGQYLVLIGALLFYYPTFLGTLALFTYANYRFYHRINAEEKMLQQHFFYEYEQFIKSRWRFIPLVF